jgi:predicted O-linked N-acetylglucosamine transferase (SPINDLY family)
LQSVGLPELTTVSIDDYVTVNTHLALDASWRKSLSARVRSSLIDSPLMDSRQFVSDLEAAFRSMWQMRQR